ncbi:hypothetical protein F5Y11DRAFT_362486 [Daldinia sp. FL1419]|nr:hypothetical protein F5Y11DRAFT_362486 [Daldinia sp. FL1419]
MATVNNSRHAAVQKVLLDALEASPSKDDGNLYDLENAIQVWIQDIQSPRIPVRSVVYMLENSSGTDISINGLTSTDLDCLHHLQSLESRYRFHVFMGQVETKDISMRPDIMGHEVKENEYDENDLPNGTYEIEAVD